MKACHTDQTWGNTKVCEIFKWLYILAQKPPKVAAIEVNCHFRIPLSCNDNSCAMWFHVHP